MGRKPNPLILKYFERGAKLNDSSNRYHHTCRACSEKFPKGRLDTLTSHICKKCPALDRAQKQRLVLEFNNLPEIADRTNNQQMNIQTANNRQTTAIRGRPFQGMTPLETLAEVSRDMAESEHRSHRPGNESPQGDGQQPMSRGDNLELQEQYTLDNPPLSYESRSQRDKKGINQKGHGSEFNLGRSQSASPNSMAATAAAASRFIPSMVDPQLLSEDAVAQDKISEDKLTRQLVEANAMSDGLFNGSSDNQQHSWSMMEVSMPASQAAAMQVQDQMAHMGQMTYSEHNPAENTFDNGQPQSQSPKSHTRIAMNPMTTEFSAEYGNGQKATKPKVRGKFNEGRRKEVSDIRKIGSCIRCRMLKKPCTAGDPCDTCKGVESARLWKTPCIRTRVAHELCLYSAKLHTVLAHHQVLAAKGSATFQNSPYQIEVSHFPGTTIYASFPCLEAHDADTGLTSYILDTDNDDLSTKLEAYAKRMMPIFIDNEPSQFIRTTLQTALNLSIQKQDNFLSRALELWTIVHIFVDSEIRWEMSAKAISGLPDEEGGQTKAILSTERSFAIIHTQLNAAAENKASQMCKGILNELERRLLNKASKSSFELFLVAIITLNCVEKSTWLFKCWEGEDFHGQWPLDKPPQHFANQGDDLINVLQMILRMREVPPKTFVRQDNGVLAVDDASEQVVRDFFEQVQLSFTDVHDKQVRYFFDPADSRSYELRYISRLLLPQVSN
ncbi:hypothetical protein EAF04_003489 [Stromatinia cepivora]|nr:hypothetical protein EAF04_003489 [Stromatinia cepivora]